MTRTTQDIFDEWLVLRCQSGQDSAFAELIRRWQERLLDQARRLVRDEGDAIDALQETLIAMARSMHRLDDPALFGAWARRILAYKCADAVRRRQQQRRMIAKVADRSPGDGGSEAAGSADEDEPARVRLAIDLLPMDSRALLVMRYARDMTTQQMAAALCLREGTVKSRLHQARHELKMILERTSQ
jgi:RNA polymerase sigma-70 factor (ECF subfamily)